MPLPQLNRGALARSHVRVSVLHAVKVGFLLSACSFYTDCPCANQPKPTTGGGAGMAGTAGAGTGGQSTGGTGTGGTSAGGTGGETTGGAAGMSGEGNMPMPGVWVNATGNLTGRNSANGGVNFLSPKPDEDMLVAGVYQDGLWASTDGGKSWSALGEGSKSVLIANIPSTLVYDPDHPKTFWEVGIYGPGMYRTDDNGQNFLSVGSLNHNDYASFDWSDPKRQFILAGSHETAGTLYRSTDGGDNWEQIGDTIPDTCKWSSFPIVLDQSNYLLGCWNGVLATSDAGKTWNTLISYGGACVPLITADGTIYFTIASNGGLIGSSDQGQTWTRLVGGGVISSAHPVELPDGSLASTNMTNEVVRSKDGGMTWSPITPALAFAPAGLVYSKARSAFYVWHTTMDATIPDNSIQRYDWSDF